MQCAISCHYRNWFLKLNIPYRWAVWVTHQIASAASSFWSSLHFLPTHFRSRFTSMECTFLDLSVNIFFCKILMILGDFSQLCWVCLELMALQKHTQNISSHRSAPHKYWSPASKPGGMETSDSLPCKTVWWDCLH